MYIAFKDNLQITDDSFNSSLTKYSTLLPASYACPVAESCLGSLDSTCSQGYEGPLCGVCAQGYFKLLTKCQRCPSLPWIAIQFVIVFALVSLVAFLTLRDRKKEEHAQRSVADILFLGTHYRTNIAMQLWLLQQIAVILFHHVILVLSYLQYLESNAKLIIMSIQMIMQQHNMHFEQQL